MISIHIGKAGIQQGGSYWELYCHEHDIPMDGVLSSEKNDSLNTSFFSENCFGSDSVKRTPKAIFVDLDSDVLDEIRWGNQRFLIPPTNMIHGKGGTGNNYARGRYNSSATCILNECMERIRRLNDYSWDVNRGFMIFSSVGGGTGSGFGSLLMESLSDEFDKLPKMCFNIYSDPNESPIIVDPYNTILSTSSLMNHSDVSVVYDNEAVFNICRKYLNIELPKYRSVNRLLSHVISSTTVSMRFNGYLNGTLSNLVSNLIPYPTLNFLLQSYSPIIPHGSDQHNTKDVTEITHSALENLDLMLAKVNPVKGRYMSSCLMYRGDVVPQEIKETLQTVKAKNIARFVDWMPNNFKCGIFQCSKRVNEEELSNESRSVCMIANSTAISEVFERTQQRFDKIYSKKAFLHWFLGEGMEESELMEAREQVLAIQNDYKEVFNEH